MGTFIGVGVSACGSYGRSLWTPKALGPTGVWLRPDPESRTVVDKGGGAFEVAELIDRVGGVAKAVNVDLTGTRPSLDLTWARPGVRFTAANLEFLCFAAGELASASTSHTFWCSYDAVDATGATQAICDVQTGRLFPCHLVNAGNKSGHFDNWNAYVGVAAAAAGRQSMLWQFNGATSKVQLYRNGASLGEGNYHGYPVGGAVGIGASYVGYNLNFNGVIYDWYWRPSLLSADELALLHGYLARYA
jgi:hypothetical protein